MPCIVQRNIKKTIQHHKKRLATTLIFLSYNHIHCECILISRGERIK
ncbi:hypothetical protein Lalb_Chr13g0294581 [Lupinus albus]|uniref:Uncharacterized protein n=1 Tax=Lupinus albus TaxID=3870 RepID=A0A6A4PHW6_LUPAL|nr:hypothetical protein Lalb_Chr13g0294581 [Lupinus albus]